MIETALLKIKKKKRREKKGGRFGSITLRAPQDWDNSRDPGATTASLGIYKSVYTHRYIFTHKMKK